MARNSAAPTSRTTCRLDIKALPVEHEFLMNAKKVCGSALKGNGARRLPGPLILLKRHWNHEEHEEHEWYAWFCGLRDLRGECVFRDVKDSRSRSPWRAPRAS